MKKVLFLFALASAMIMSSCSPKSQLEFQVKQTNKQCPASAGPGMTLTKMYIEDNNVISVCDVDETIAGFEVSVFDSPEVIAQMKPSVIQAISTAKGGEKLVDLLKETESNLVYRLIGSPSNKQVDIIIYPSEL